MKDKLSFYPIYATMYIYLRASPLVPEKIEDGLWRNREPYGSSCTEQHPVRLARDIAAPVERCSYIKVVQLRNCGPMIWTTRVDA